jgi:ABC-2 type transport system ATP-binding protein
VTLLDEPYLGLDVTARALFHDVLLRDYEAHPRTILLSTHLIDESESLFDRVVIMDRGRVVLDLDRDDARTAAVVATGASDAVTRLGAGRTVLESHAVGGLGSATMTGDIGDEFQAEARRNGVQIAAASLQQLVAAYGADEPQTSEKPETSEKPKSSGKPETSEKRAKRVGTRA